MTEINTNSASDVLADYRYEPKTNASGSSELGKNQFMELMIAQMENQNPLEPQDNGEFISQLAEFSSLEEMQKLTTTVNSFATQYQSTQALQASAMVGRSVLVPGTEAPLNAEGGMNGVIDLPSSTSSLNVSVFNRSGELVNKWNMGQQVAGSIPFVWDGTNSEGEQMPADQYTIKAEANIEGDTKQMNTLLTSNVNSVSIAQGGVITLNLSGMGAIPLENVRQIN